MTSVQQVIVFRNPQEVLVLVHAGGRIVKATCPDYIGMSLGAARLAATSVMRWWDCTLQDNAYPETVEVLA